MWSGASKKYCKKAMYEPEKERRFYLGSAEQRCAGGLETTNEDAKKKTRAEKYRVPSVVSSNRTTLYQNGVDVLGEILTLPH